MLACYQARLWLSHHINYANTQCIYRSQHDRSSSHIVNSCHLFFSIIADPNILRQVFLRRGWTLMQTSAFNYESNFAAILVPNKIDQPHSPHEFAFVLGMRKKTILLKLKLALSFQTGRLLSESRRETVSTRGMATPSFIPSPTLPTHPRWSGLGKRRNFRRGLTCFTGSWTWSKVACSADPVVQFHSSMPRTRRATQPFTALCNATTMSYA